ncbi:MULTISPECIES: hypothetical protein [unclassified Streptomyces]|uniref:hypothetical protein n=1 Tax=unclassified Streptomyces TaxID=2593676 RepID=UPI002DDA59AD|nr:hypothetical protein [Streptomyces sp. NBC_01750]WSA98164.1 hypothetical protein OIE54_02210 [Streptomyces sp. NBC_01794]WSD37299.1 hypothetical protein OG966_38565 [Streptomyces sp. NBC_01750]
MTISTRDQSVPQSPELTVTVVRLEHTGHVVAALTRATPGPPPAVRLLTQRAIPLAVPGASGLVLVPTGLLTTEELSAPRDILAAPWRWYVDTGGEQAATPAMPQLKPVSCPAPSVGLTEGSLTITSSTTDGAAPVLALVHPTAQWGAGSAVSLQIRDVLGPDGSALMGNGAVEDSDEALVFVRGRPVTVYSPGEID